MSSKKAAKAAFLFLVAVAARRYTGARGPRRGTAPHA